MARGGILDCLKASESGSPVVSFPVGEEDGVLWSLSFVFAIFRGEQSKVDSAA